jgi:hypothetical protein
MISCCVVPTAVSEQGQARFGQGGFELGAEVVLVSDEGLGASVGAEAGSVCRMSSRTVRSPALAPVSAKPMGRGVQGGKHVQAQPPEVVGVAGAVAVLGPSGQLAAACGLAGVGAFHWGRVDRPRVIGPESGVAAGIPISQLVVAARLRSRLL